MATIRISLPATITSPEPPTTVECVGATVGEALRDLTTHSPRLSARVFYNDRLLVSVVRNGIHLSPIAAKDTGLADGDLLELVTPVAGG